MSEEQKKEWDKHYQPISKAFYESSYSDSAFAEWKYQRYIKDYLRCIVSVDENLGRMIEYLKSTGEWDNTLVIYTSDQGFFLGEHGWYDKRWMYDESLKMPFIVKWPGVTKPGSRNTDLIQNLDYAQTFLELAGAKIPEDMQGKSLVPLLKGNTPKDWRKSIYYHYYEYSLYYYYYYYALRSHNYVATTAPS